MGPRPISAMYHSPELIEAIVQSPTLAGAARNLRLSVAELESILVAQRIELSVVDDVPFITHTSEFLLIRACPT